MSGYTSGSYSLGNTGSVGVGGTFYAMATAGQNPTGAIDFTLTTATTSAFQTFDIQSAVGSTVIVNAAALAGQGDVIDLTTNGGSIGWSSDTVKLADTVNVSVMGGGDFAIGGTDVLSLFDTMSVTYAGVGGTLTVGTAGVYAPTFEPTAVNDYNASGDRIDNLSLEFSKLTSYTVTGAPTGAQTITVDDGPGAGSFSFTTANADLRTGTFFSLTGGPLNFSEDASGGTVIGAVCFLAGTKLAIPDGEAAVEALRVGDMVATRIDGGTVFRPIVWIGRRTMDVTRTPGEIEAYPVRIRAGAFAPNIPHRDLLVTSEHCLHADGKLVPARMLVNGGSIIVDTGMTRYDYFHIELESHAILVAEGLEAESYLDTGNRGNFSNAAVPSLTSDFAVDPSQDAWTTRAAAPLAVDRETVEPIWGRLVERARGMGLTAGTGVSVCGDPDLRVVTDAGVEIRPSMADGIAYAFVIPGGARSLRLLSRAARPSETVGPFVDDRRMLGVLVGKVGLGVGRRRRATNAADFSGELPGWHAPEAGAAFRWTDGDAVLPLDLSAWEGAPVFLDVEVAAAGPYPAAALAA